MEALKKALRTSEFWLSAALGVAAALESFGVAGAKVFVENAAPILIVIAQRILSKTLKPGQVPFQVVAAMLGGALLLAPAPARAADLSDVVRFYGGVNGAWFDGPEAAFPQDVEVGGNGRASLSKHLSGVGAVYYGFDHSYVRWSVGGRITATDVDNPDFSVGLGIQYHGASQNDLGPGEWAPDASFGWRPSPELYPRLVVVGQGGYGLTSNTVRVILGLRWAIPI